MSVKLPPDAQKMQWSVAEFRARREEQNREKEMESSGQQRETVSALVSVHQSSVTSSFSSAASGLSTIASRAYQSLSFGQSPQKPEEKPTAPFSTAILVEADKAARARRICGVFPEHPDLTLRFASILEQLLAKKIDPSVFKPRKDVLNDGYASLLASFAALQKTSSVKPCEDDKQG